MTHEEFTREMARLTAAYREILPDTTVEVYWQALRSHQIIDFIVAVDQALTSLKRFPSIAELTQGVHEARHARALAAAGAATASVLGDETTGSPKVPKLCGVCGGSYRLWISLTRGEDGILRCGTCHVAWLKSRAAQPTDLCSELGCGKTVAEHMAEFREISLRLTRQMTDLRAPHPKDHLPGILERQGHPGHPWPRPRGRRALVLLLGIMLVALSLTACASRWNPLNACIEETRTSFVAGRWVTVKTGGWDCEPIGPFPIGGHMRPLVIEPLR